MFYESTQQKPKMEKKMDSDRLSILSVIYQEDRNEERRIENRIFNASYAFLLLFIGGNGFLLNHNTTDNVLYFLVLCYLSITVIGYIFLFSYLQKHLNNVIQCKEGREKLIKKLLNGKEIENPEEFPFYDFSKNNITLPLNLNWLKYTVIAFGVLSILIPLLQCMKATCFNIF